jgi:hypothetical protein
METINFTEKEMLLMNIIAHCEYTPAGGATPLNAEEAQTYTDVKTWAVNMDEDMATVKGVLGSLDKKGALVVDIDCGENMVAFTEAGFNSWVDAYQINVKKLAARVKKISNREFKAMLNN